MPACACSVPFEALIIGASSGGVALLAEMLPSLPARFPAPLILCLHAGAETTPGLVSLLRSKLRLDVEEAQDGVRPDPGTVYVAPGGYHLLMERNGCFSLSVDEPVRFARPSVDVLFETAAACWGNRLVALILSGASADGAAGARAVKDHGGSLIVQTPASARAPVMPSAAIQATTPDAVLPPDAIIPAVLEWFAPGQP